MNFIYLNMYEYRFIPLKPISSVHVPCHSTRSQWRRKAPGCALPFSDGPVFCSLIRHVAMLKGKGYVCALCSASAVVTICGSAPESGSISRYLGCTCWIDDNRIASFAT